MEWNIGTPVSFEDIAKASGRGESVCSCSQCKNQCRTPCLGTPQDIGRLIDAGYADRLAPTIWMVGMILGLSKKPIQLIAPKVVNGWCTFRRPDGLCELHDKGLKPTEGRLAHHDLNKNDLDPRRNLTWLVASTWRGFDSFVAAEIAEKENGDKQEPQSKAV